MFKDAIFRCKLTGINCMTDDELLALLEKVGLAIQSVHANALIDPAVVVDSVQPETQHTMLGGAAVDGYMKVERKSGQMEYFYNVNGESLPITEDAYNKAHN